MVIFGGFGVMLLIPTVLTSNLYILTGLFAAATFSYAMFTTIANVLPADLFPSNSVASVSGMSGTGAAISMIIVFELAGHLSDARVAAGTHVFDPLMVIAGLIPLTGAALVLLLVRNTRRRNWDLYRKSDMGWNHCPPLNLATTSLKRPICYHFRRQEVSRRISRYKDGTRFLQPY